MVFFLALIRLHLSFILHFISRKRFLKAFLFVLMLISCSRSNLIGHLRNVVKILIKCYLPVLKESNFVECVRAWVSGGWKLGESVTISFLKKSIYCVVVRRWICLIVSTQFNFNGNLFTCSITVTFRGFFCVCLFLTTFIRGYGVDEVCSASVIK